MAMRALGLSSIALVLTLGGLCAELRAYAGGEGPSYELIVDPDSALGAADRKFLEDAFLKKVITWSDGRVIRPVDLAADSPTRKRFSEEVLRRSVEAVKSYWQERIFSGRDVPPPEFDTDQEVVTYVLNHPGAVGYVTEGTDLRGTKVISVR